MFGMGFNEILLITIIGLIVIGPRQLPELARTIGQLLAKFRRTSNEFRDMVNHEVHGHELRKAELQIKEVASSIEKEIKNPLEKDHS